MYQDMLVIKKCRFCNNECYCPLWQMIHECGGFLMIKETTSDDE